ncbi:unnamed protein product [Adineta steineri]|uniref:Uncharacterized protein n=1 Tax=Adineta steineri TaxID=433720 RepID=A0A814QP13_9BILA|nr:unnamed protein product [Adineta steineri]CAF3484218.1 unnamed protein product [Adineta steineri]
MDAGKIISSLVVCDVSVTIDENRIKNELMDRYNGVANVTRMFFDDEDETPKTSVQVDFTLPDVARQILRDRSIVIGGICRRVYPIKKSVYQQTFTRSQKNRQNTAASINEQDLLNLFEEQKKTLAQIINSLDEKLNHAIKV